MFYGTGKRKTAIAKVRLFSKTELTKKPEMQISVNNEVPNKYFKVQRFNETSIRAIKWSCKLLAERAKGLEITRAFVQSAIARNFTNTELESLNAISTEEAAKLKALLEDETYLKINIKGGGVSSQAEAAMYGIAKTLVQSYPILKTTLRAIGLATRDCRKVERKKPGLRKARKSEQFSKR